MNAEAPWPQRTPLDMDGPRSLWTRAQAAIWTHRLSPVAGNVLLVIVVERFDGNTRGYVAPGSDTLFIGAGLNPNRTTDLHRALMQLRAAGLLRIAPQMNRRHHLTPVLPEVPPKLEPWLVPVDGPRPAFIHAATLSRAVTRHYLTRRLMMVGAALSLDGETFTASRKQLHHAMGVRSRGTTEEHLASALAHPTYQGGRFADVEPLLELTGRSEDDPFAPNEYRLLIPGHNVHWSPRHGRLPEPRPLWSPSVSHPAPKATPIGTPNYVERPHPDRYPEGHPDRYPELCSDPAPKATPNFQGLPTPSTYTSPLPLRARSPWPPPERIGRTMIAASDGSITAVEDLQVSPIGGESR